MAQARQGHRSIYTHCDRVHLLLFKHCCLHFSGAFILLRLCVWQRVQREASCFSSCYLSLMTTVIEDGGNVSRQPPCMSNPDPSSDPNPDPNPDHKPEPKPGITNYINWRARIFGGWTKNELKMFFCLKLLFDAYINVYTYITYKGAGTGDMHIFSFWSS